MHRWLLIPTLVLMAQAALAGEEADLPHAFAAGWMGQDTCELLLENETMRVGRCTFPPGVGHEKHYHKPHFGYVLESGSMRIVDGEGERVVHPEAGASWSTQKITVHEALNVGDTTTSYLIVEPIKQ